MKLMFKYCFVVAIMAIAVLGCDKKTEIQKTSPNDASVAAKFGDVSTLALSCETCTRSTSRSLRGDTVCIENFGDYCAWEPKRDTLCTASGLVLQFEGQFNSFVRVVSSGWKIGTTTGTTYCTNLLRRVDNVGTHPPTCTYSPTGPSEVVGMSGTYNDGTYSYSFGLGYYTYNTTTNAITINRQLVVWDTGNTPANANRAYLITISSIVPTSIGSGGGCTDRYYSTISYTYTCLTSCT